MQYTPEQIQAAKQELARRQNADAATSQDVSPQQLARQELARRGISLKTPEVIAQSGVAAGSTPPSLKDKLKNYVSQAAQVPTDIQDSIMEGLSRFGAGVGQLVYPAIDRVAGTDLTAQLKQERDAKSQAFNQRFANRPAYQATALASEIAPMFIGGGAINAAKAPELLMQAVQGAPKAMRGLTSLAGIAGKNAALTRAYAPIGYDPIFQKTGLTGGLQKAAEAAPLGEERSFEQSRKSRHSGLLKATLLALAGLSPFITNN